MLRYDKGELEGIELLGGLTNPDHQELTCERARVRMQGENVPSQYEVKLQRKDGSSFDGKENEPGRKSIFLTAEPGNPSTCQGHYRAQTGGKEVKGKRGEISNHS